MNKFDPTYDSLRAFLFVIFRLLDNLKNKKKTVLYTGRAIFWIWFR